MVIIINIDHPFFINIICKLDVSLDTGKLKREKRIDYGNVYQPLFWFLITPIIIKGKDYLILAFYYIFMATSQALQITVLRLPTL